MPGVYAERALLNLMAPFFGARALAWAFGDRPTGYKQKGRHYVSTGPGKRLVVAAGQGMSFTAARAGVGAKV